MKAYCFPKEIDTESFESEEQAISRSEPIETNKTKLGRSIKVNIGRTRYSIVKEVCKILFNYTLTANTNNDWDLMWADTGINATFVSKMKLYQKVNHFPSMSCLARKNNLAKNLMRMRRHFPREYSFFPPSWVMPKEYNEFKAYHVKHQSDIYIVKPEAMCQGRGIFLIHSPENIDSEDCYVVQRYLNNPYLIEGLKFDLRIYVLVYGCDPLRVYIYKEGLVRLATEKYEKANARNIDNKCMHLTNYAINKKNENFIFNEDEDKADIGNKRSLGFLWSYIDSQGGNSKLLLKRIKRIIVKSLCAVQPQLAHSYRTCQPNDVGNNMCFEVLGFDVLLDEKLKPWLLEVNHTPSFCADTPFDYKVKKELIYNTIKLLDMNSSRRLKYYKKKEDELQAKALGKMQLKQTRSQLAKLRKREMEKRDEYELKNMGGYERIYPDTKMNEKYNQLIEVAENDWQEFYGYKKHAPIHNAYKEDEHDTSIDFSIEETSRKGNMMVDARKVAKPIARVNLDYDTDNFSESNGNFFKDNRT